MMKRYLSWLLLGLVVAKTAHTVTLPYTFTPGQQIQASQVNANDQALRDGINQHIAAANPHNTTLANVLSVGNSAGSTPINFNNTQAQSFRVENVSSDPVCSGSYVGRLIWNTVDSLYKICNGSSFVSIAGSGVNTLQSVLSAGNSAGSSNLNMNLRQLLSARIENVSSDPSAGNAGRLIYNTTSNTLKVDNGTTLQAVGGAQGLASVLTTSNSAGSTDVDFNGQSALKLKLENLSTDPATTYAGRVYYNTTSNKARYYDGGSSTWKDVGNTNTLAQTMALGASVGSNDLDMNGKQLKNAFAESLASSPGTGIPGRYWYNSTLGKIQYGDASVTRTVADLDGTQTLTNKSISGSSNTLTNIPDSALSANVDLLDTAQTISAKKTFSAAPEIARIKTAAGTTNGHLVPTGLADDTFTLNKAVQELEGKTLKSPTLSGNLDFANYQGVNLRVQNVTATPTAGNLGRIVYKTTTNELLYDDGTNFRVLTANTTGVPTLSQVLASGNSAGSTDVDFALNKALNIKIENVASLPSFGNIGRVVFNTADSKLYVDTGAAWSPVGSGSAFSGTANRVVITDGLGALTTSGITTTTLGYLDPTSSIQTQLNGKEPSITAGSTAQYLRGDKSLSTFSTDARAAFSATAPIGISSGVVSCTTAASGVAGCLSNTAFDTFNNKQAAGNYLTALTGEVAASGPGSATATIQANAIVDSKVSSSAAITRSKLANGTNYRILANSSSGVMSENAAITGSRAVASDANGQLVAATTTATELGYVNGVTSSIQTQLNQKGGGTNLLHADSSYLPNNVTNSDAEISVGGWAAYADAAGTVPVDMTGGSPTTTITRTTSTPLDGAGSFLCDLGTGASRQGEGCSVLVYVAPAYRGQNQQFTFPFSVSGSITDGDLVMYAYDVTNSVLMAPSYVGGKIIGSSGTASAVFPVSSTTAQMRIGVHVARTATTALSLKLDNVKLTPNILPVGMAGSNTRNDLTWTFNGLGTPTVVDVKYARVGDRMFVQGYLVVGTSTATTLSITLPTGYSIDGTKVGTASSGFKVGEAHRMTSGTTLPATSGGPWVVFYNGASGSAATTLFVTRDVGSNVFNAMTANAVISSGDGFQFSFNIPIAGWDANVQMADSTEFKLSSALANGSRVTATPAKIGEYRAKIKAATSGSYAGGSDNAPTAGPSIADGMRIYAEDYATAGTSGQTNYWEVFVGQNKSVECSMWSSAGRTGYLFYGFGVDAQSSANAVGTQFSYDSTAGTLLVSAATFGSSVIDAYVGRNSAGSLVANGYWDCTVKNKASSVGLDPTYLSSGTAIGEQYGRATIAQTANCTSNPCTISSQNGFLSSVTRTTTGIYVANFVTGYFSSYPTCGVFGDFYEATTSGAATATTFTWATRDSATNVVDSKNMNLICFGPR